MTRLQAPALALAFLLALTAVPTTAGPPTLEELDRQNKVIGELKLALVREQNDKGKFALIAASFAGEKDVNLRRRMLDIAARLDRSIIL